MFGIFPCMEYVVHIYDSFVLPYFKRNICRWILDRGLRLRFCSRSDDMFHMPMRDNLKAKFAQRAKITALHSQLSFEGRGVKVKSVVILKGADISPQYKTKNKTKNVNIVVWENGISMLNHGPISAHGHL